MSNLKISEEQIQSIIYEIRGKQVMLDRDLAELYQVETRVLNQAVKRNIKRFPEEFMFQLSIEENNSLKSQIVISKGNRGGRRKLPFVFTEQGVSMLSAVLRSDIAIEISIKIINAFVSMRKFLLENATIFKKFSKIEETLLSHDNDIEKIFNIIETRAIKPKQGIFFNGQIFDSYKFVVNLIKEAKNSIVLIDNYIDETVLTLFSKNQEVDITIFTKNITKQLKLDLEKYNAQYRPIRIKKFNHSHDRFLILDNDEIYHFGASLKDLGKKWFAFSKFNIEAIEILGKLE